MPAGKYKTKIGLLKGDGLKMNRCKAKKTGPIALTIEPVTNNGRAVNPSSDKRKSILISTNPATRGQAIWVAYLPLFANICNDACYDLQATLSKGITMQKEVFI